MCYAIPGKIIAINNKRLVVDYFGERKNAVNEFFPTLAVGQYIYAQSGIVVRQIGESDARAILKEWEKLFFSLKKRDTALVKELYIASPSDLQALLQKKEWSREELLHLLKLTTKEEIEMLSCAANALRQKEHSNACCVHGILEFSNHCRNLCTYCGLRYTNKKLDRYRLSFNEIVEHAKDAATRLGFTALVLQSGEDEWYSDELLIDLVRAIRKECGALLFLSVGTRSFDFYSRAYEAGARGLLMRFETSNPHLYAKFHSGEKGDLKYRLSLLKHAKQCGYLLITGGLIGLPGQTEDDILNDILLTKSLQADMYSFGPLISRRSGGIDLSTLLKALALSRLIDPGANILVTTALETLDPSGRRLGLLSGANSLMINVTPPEHKKRYALYPNRCGTDLAVESAIEQTRKLLLDLGRAPTDLGR